jgi:LPXTG-motif cell wall-anchored protein
MRASKKVQGAVLLSACSALVLGAPSVHADSSADDNSGLLGGLNLLNGVQLNLPVTVGGVGVLGVGDGDAAVSTGNTAGSTSTSGNTGGGGSSSADTNNGLVSGLNVGNNLQANVPVTVCGVGALLAHGTGACTVAAANTGGGGSSSADGNNGLVAGANALNNAQLNVPVTVCGLAVLGDADCASTVGATNTGGGSGSGAAGSSSANGNSGLIGGLNLLNNLQANIPVTVCGLAVLGDAAASCEVEATNNDGTDTTGGDNGSVKGVSKDQNSAVRGATLPHTGSAGMALIPFGLALVAGGVALRRRDGACATTATRRSTVTGRREPAGR